MFFPSAATEANCCVDVENGEVMISVYVAMVERAGASVTVVDRLQVLLLKKRRDQVVILFLARMLGFVEGVKPPIALCRVARFAGPYLIGNVLNLLADRQRSLTLRAYP